MFSAVQESFGNFENLKFDSFESKDVLLDDSNDPDKNLYNNIQAVDTQFYLPSELLFLSEKLHINSEKFSMIHLNIRSAKKNFQKLKDFLSGLTYMLATRLHHHQHQQNYFSGYPHH